MGQCVIFCAGGFNGLIAPIETDDYIIAADGGYGHVQALGLTPACLLGDFDSLGYVPRQAEVSPIEKDDTDAMLAVRRGLGAGCKEFLLYGSLDGPRLDHTVANFQTLQYLADNGATGWLIGLEQMVTVVQNSVLRFPADFAGTVSVFSMGGAAGGVTIKGLKYPLTDGILTPGFPLGVSNSFVGTESEISVQEGSLLVILSRQKTLPI